MPINYKPHQFTRPKKPHKPRFMESKNAVLTRKLNNVVYALAVRTTTDMVYTSPEYKYTLTELINDITESLLSNNRAVAENSEAFAKLMKDCPEEFNTLKGVKRYIDSQAGTSRESLMEMLEEYQHIEEGKGLSTHDFDDVMYEKLKNNYTRDELNEKFLVLFEKSTNLENRISALEQDPSIKIYTLKPDNLKNGEVWMLLVKNERDD